MSAIVLFTYQEPFYFSSLPATDEATVNSALPFQIKENMVNHKKMVHPPCEKSA